MDALQQKGITPQSIEHRNAPVVLLRYAKEQTNVTKAVRACGGRWSKTHTSWYVPRDKNILEKIVLMLSGQEVKKPPQKAASSKIKFIAALPEKKL